jgi:radical SAM protein with 4Fe4S-binding SPASM domain
MPWVSVQITSEGLVRPCCVSDYRYAFGSIKNSSLEKIWNGEEIKKFRLDLLNGKKLDTCQNCHYNESLGKSSLRQYTNQKYKKHYSHLEHTDDTGKFDKLNLVLWDFRFSNLCNFKCVMCGPENSSSWGSDLKKILKRTEYDPIKRIEIWEELEPLYDIVEEIYFAGGEPLIMDEHYKIINKLIELKKFNVVLKYNTNFSVIDYKGINIIDLWKKFDDVQLTISLDGYSGRGELIRKGLDWEKFVDNISILNREYGKSYTIDCVAQALNINHLFDMHKNLLYDDMIKSVDDFNIYFLTDPEYLSIDILPKSMKKELSLKAKEHIEQFLIPNNSKKSIQQFESLINLLNTCEDKSHLLPKFKKYISALDNFRNQNTSNVFPELKNILST